MFKLEQPGHSKLIIIRAIIAEKVVPTLFDTGASISIISSSLIEHFNLKQIEKRSIVRGFNAQSECSGVTFILMTIGIITEEVKFHIIENTNHPIILGLDHIQKFHLNMDENHQIIQTIKESDHKIEITIERLSDTIGISINSLTESPIDSLLSEFSDIFSKHKYDIGSIDIEKCQINLQSDIPISLKPYRCSESDQKILENQLALLLKHNLIRRSVSPYSAPVTLVNKKDEGEKTRLCIDFRKLNQISIADNYPFPRIEDIIDKLSGSIVFSTIDISSGFWHVRVNPGDIHKTGFVTQNDHFEWLVMPFGFRNSPAIFQRIIYRILEKHNLKSFAHNYIDDILIHSRNLSEHLIHLRAAFIALREENVKLKLSKCKFAENQVTYLGHLIRPNEISPLNDNISAITNLPAPTCKKSLQRLLGKINYYR